MDAGDHRKRESGIVWLLLGLMLLQLGVVVAYQNGLNHDVAMLVTMADMLRQGAVPMRDMLDTNPPMIVYLSLVPTFVRDLTGLDVVRASNLSTILFLLLTGGLCAIFLGRIVPDQRRALRLLFLAAWLYLAATVIWLGEFGQRDQLIAAALLPYALMRAGQAGAWRPQWGLQFVVALLVAVAIMMKPMYLAVPIGVEVWLLLRLRWSAYVRTAHVLAFAAFVAALLVALLEPLRVYYTDWWPLMLEYHKALKYSVKGVLFETLRKESFHFSVFVLLLSWVLQRALRQSPVRLLLEVLSVLYLAAFFTMLVQGKGWGYHLIPMRVAIWLLAGFSLYTFFAFVAKDRRIQRYGLAISVGLFTVLQFALFPSITSWLRTGAPQPPGNALSRTIEVHSQKSDYVVAVSAGVHNQFPAITYSGRRYGSRYYFAFPVIMSYSGQSTMEVIKGREWFEAKYLRELEEDIRRNAPAVLIVDTRSYPWWFPEGMTMKTWLGKHDFFTKSGKAYRLVRRLPELEVEVYIRAT